MAKPISLPDDSVTEFLCRTTRAETPDIRTFIFANPGAPGFEFRAGQFVTVSVAVDGVSYERCYTLTSADLRHDSLAIAVKRIPGGPVSNWLHDHLKPGMPLRIRRPRGVFTLQDHPATAHLLLAAGSGITPMISMLRSLPADVAPKDIVLLYSARTPADLAFRDELDCMAGKRAGIRIVYLCSRAAVPSRLSLDVLHRDVPDFAGRRILACGPAGYRDLARQILGDNGVPADRFHEESFQFAGAAPAPRSAHSEARVFKLHLRQHGRTVPCRSDEPLLAAALKAGIVLPSACAEGICGTCMARMISGKVEMRAQGGIGQGEIDNGCILPCCSWPQGDVELDA